MEIVVIFNGLGNQMSQYAFYLAKKEQCKHCIPYFEPLSSTRHNGLELTKLFGVRFPHVVVRLFLRVLYSLASRLKAKDNWFVTIYREPLDYTYTPSLLKKGKAWFNFYYGGWHSERYFKEVKEEVLKTFTFNLDHEKEDDFILWKDLIQSTPHSVSLHVRRGDYLTFPANGYYQFSGVATLDYYRSALNRMKQLRGHCEYFVFSDDIQWCRQCFGDTGFHYIGGNKKEKSWRDLALMSLCRDHINANSSFSWWGAWLSKQPEGITLHPKEFIRGVNITDFYPASWIEIL